MRGLERCRQFLAEKSPDASRRAARAISQQFTMPETNPLIGRPLHDEPELRELIVSFGDSGYTCLYRFEPPEDSVYLLAFRHQKEAGYFD